MAYFTVRILRTVVDTVELTVRAPGAGEAQEKALNLVAARPEMYESRSPSMDLEPVDVVGQGYDADGEGW